MLIQWSYCQCVLILTAYDFPIMEVLQITHPLTCMLLTMGILRKEPVTEYFTLSGLECLTT